MLRKDVMTCNKAIAEAVKLCDVDVIAAYPITPQTSIVEYLAEFVAKKEMDAEYIKVESEHSALSALVGASAAGARTFTATSSQGLILMSEVMFTASGMRLPIVMANANRALSAPLNIWNDQQDSLAVRDSGWIQFYAENNQEALDYVVQCYKISENKKVMLPSMINLDGFYLTHTLEPTEIPDKEDVKKFLPPYEPEYYLNPESPLTFGFFAGPESYQEFRYEQQKAMENAEKAIKEVVKDYYGLTGRKYSAIEEYRLDKKDIVLLTIGSVSGTAKEVADKLEKEYSVGVAKLRMFRPFPFEEIRGIASRAKIIGVIEKDVIVGVNQGVVATEIKNALYNSKSRVPVISFIVGLGGRDTPPSTIEKIIKICDASIEKPEKESYWMDLK
ncbi:MAG: pyruvate synthase subunit PorA [Candidatus Hydrothermarchaeota archaeon]|nr:pyruvate synthase subunit PorA [Candidatus Hydrothermarchaeota archaeon]